MLGRAGRARHRLLGAGAGGGSPEASLHHPFKHPRGTGTLSCYLLDRDSRKSLDHRGWAPLGMIWEFPGLTVPSAGDPRQVPRTISCALPRAWGGLGC